MRGFRLSIGPPFSSVTKSQLQDSPQIEDTSLTHCESHSVEQQYGSDVQMSPAQASQVLVSFTPVEQIV